MRIAFTVFVVSSLAVAVPREGVAGAWTRGFGSHYLKVGADYYVPRSYVDPVSGAASDARYLGQQYSLYGEVGVLPGHPLQVSVLLPLNVASLTFTSPTDPDGGEGTATTARPGDLRFGVQVALLSRKLQLGAFGEVKLPLYSNDSIGAEYGTWREVFPRFGDGQVDVTLGVVAGGSVPGAPLWIEGGIGYRFRTEAFVGWDVDLEFIDSVVFRGSAGVSAGPVLVMLQADGNKNVARDEVTREGLALGPAVLVTVWKGLAIEARFAGEVWTANASRGVSFGAGLSWRWPK